MKFFFVIILSLIGFSKLLNAQGFEWAKQTGGSSNSQQSAGGLVNDRHGNIYLAGVFSESIKFVDSTIQSKGSFDIFLVKYNANGDKIWSRTFGNEGYDGIANIAIDSTGSVLLLGNFMSDSITFGNHVLHHVDHQYDMFLAKIDSTGKPIWAVSKSGYDHVEGKSLTIDKVGNIFTTGFYDDPTSGKSIDLFLTKYDPLGNVLFNINSSGSGMEISNGVTTDDDGNIFITGTFLGELSIGGFIFENSSLNPASLDAFLMKLDSNGTPIWISQIKGDGSEQSFDVVTDHLGNAYITGDFDHIAYFGTTIKLGVDTTRIPYASDIFIVKYDKNGNALWGKTSRSQQGFAWGSRIILSPSGYVFVAGFVAYQFFADNGEYISVCTNNENAMVVGLDTLGSVKYLSKVGGSGASSAQFISFDKNGNCAIAGSFSGPVTVGYYPLTLSGTSNVFIAKLPPPPWRFAGGIISAADTARCSKPITITLDTKCNSFPTDAATGTVSIEISKVNSNSFFIPPHLIGQSSSNVITCELPDTLRAGVYSLRALGSNTIISNTIEITVKCDTTSQNHGTGNPPPSDYPVFIPNVFTPNEDGKNDLFQVVYSGSEKVSIEIYNRWGELIDTVDDAKIWSGKDYSPGVYYYRVNVGKIAYKGWLSLIR